jgi:parallel beta-helix repeat protein
MMKAIFFALFTFAFAVVHANTYYFSSSSGNDYRSAKEAQNPSTPWQSISKLNSIFSDLDPGDQVLFKRGETFYGSISILKSRELYGPKGNNSTNPIIIGAYGSGAKPVITGLQAITNWVPIGGGIYETSLTQDNLNLVTFQDALQPIGRWPKVTDSRAGYLPLQSHVGTSSISSNAIAGAPNFSGGEIVIRKLGWILDRGTIYNQTSSTVFYTPSPSPAHSTTYEPLDGFGFFFQNHINALTGLGDWMYDKSAKKMRMYFGSSSPYSYNVQVPTVENLVNIESSTYITLDNISLKGANSNAVNLDYAYNIQITNCDFNFSGLNAITTTKTSISSDISVTGCNISNSVNNGITAYGTSNWQIRNNSFTNTGLIRGMGVSGDGQYIAIMSPGTNSVIEYNEIRNTGYNAIDFKGENTTIKNNFIDNFCTVKSDGGGIYNSGEYGKKGRKIIGNIILNGIGDLNGRKEDEANNPLAGNVHGIYMDQGASDVEMTDNTVANCSGSGLEISSAINMKVTNNTFFNNTHAQIYYMGAYGPVSNLNVTNNILFALKRNQLVNLIGGSNGTAANWGTIDYNYYCRPLSEPSSIDVGGYSKLTLDDYTDGGIVQTNYSRFLSLDKWQQYNNQDYNTKKTPVPVTDINSVRFEYNPSTSAKTISLDAQYTDVRGIIYANSVTLAPYTSIILLRSGAQTAQNDQTISFSAINNKTLGDPAFLVNASASSGLPVSFRIVSGPATVSGSTITITGTGLVTVEASQAGNSSFKAAAPVTQSFNIVSVQTYSKPAFVNNNLIVLDANCGNSDGNISIIPTQGVAPFMYSIDGGLTYKNGPNGGLGFQNLAAGVYRLRIKDATGTESDIVDKTVKSLNCPTSATCTPPKFINNGLIVLDASCNNNDGNISIIPTRGVAPFQYSIDGGATYVKGPDAGYGFMNLSAGSYRLRLKDANGCESDIVEKNVRVVYGAPCFGSSSSAVSSTTTTSPNRAISDLPVVQAENVKVYPNPSNGEFKVQLLNYGGATEVSVIDAKGAVIKKNKISATNGSVIDYNLKGQARGLYYIRITSTTGTKTFKVVIQ